MTSQTFSTLIPFSGFYYSIHSDILDTEENQMFSDSDEVETYDNLADIFYAHVNYSKVREEYARFYVNCLKDEIGLQFMEFEEMLSPREYNFETDRVFASVSRSDLLKMFHDVMGTVLDETIREMFTSRSGFISYYSNDINEWPPIDEWDHNQVGAVLAAYLKKNHSDFEEKIVETIQGDGSVFSFLYDSADFMGQAAADLASLKRRLK